MEHESFVVVFEGVDASAINNAITVLKEAQMRRTGSLEVTLGTFPFSRQTKKSIASVASILDNASGSKTGVSITLEATDTDVGVVA